MRPSRHLGTKAEQWIFSSDPYIQNELRRIEINSINRHILRKQLPNSDSHLEQLHLKFSIVWTNDGPQSFQYLAGGVSRKAIRAPREARPNDPTVPTLHIR